MCCLLDMDIFYDKIEIAAVLNRARKCVTIHGVIPRDWSSLGSKRDNWGLVTRIIHNEIVYGICILHCCTLWFRYKHLYLTNCLNSHNHNTCVRLPQTGCTTRKMALFIISQDRQTQVLAAIAMATTIIID